MTLIYFLIVIGILVFVHEFGHFITAKRAGVRVEKFSLGMGPKIIGYKKGDTEYVISALPLGGYVKMAGENPDEESTGAPDEFQSKTPWQRAKIALAGASMNLVLAFLLMPFVFLIGASIPAYLEEPAAIGWVEAGSAGEKAGFRRGDVIQEIKGRTVENWTKALSIIAANPSSPLEVVVLRSGNRATVPLVPETDSRSGTGEAGLLPIMPPRIKDVNPGMPAEKAGIRAGDTIVSVNGAAIDHWLQFSNLVKKSIDQELTIVVRRDNADVTVKVAPVKSESLGFGIIGVVNDVRMIKQRYGVVESVIRGFKRTLDLFALTVDVLKQLFSFKLSIKSMGGPISIAQMSGQAAKSGLADFLAFMSFISLQLGILNLLPIPILDGGLVVFLIIEAIRKKPLSRKVMEISQGVGLVLLLSLIIVISYNDVMRMFFNK